MFTMINSVRIVKEKLRFHLNVKPVLYWTLYLKLLQKKLFLNFLRYVRCTKKIFCLSFVADFFFRANLVQGGAPGTQFGRGSHTIVYTASDKTGATTYCSFSFKITGKSSLISNNNVCYQSSHSYCRLFSSGESQNFTCSFDVRSNPVAIAWVRSM